MVARPASPTRSGNAGEFSPGAAGRVDIKQYYSAGLAYKNCEPVPQGGCRQMGGTWRRGRWRRPISAVAITSPVLSAGPHTGTQTVWTGTVAGAVAGVVVAGFDISAGTATFTVEAQVGGDWIAIAGPFAVTDPDRAETRCAAFAPGEQKSATALRVRASFSTSSTVAIGSVAAFGESGSAASPRYIALTHDDGTAYSLFVSAGIVDVFTGEGHVGAATVPAVTSGMLPDLDAYAEGRTVGLFHSELESVRLFQATPGQHHDWRADAWPFAAMPVADLGGSYAKTNDVWEIFLRWSASTVDPLYLSVAVDGETIQTVFLKDGGGNAVSPEDGGADWAQLALDMQTALRALPSLGNGVGVVQVATGGYSYKYVVTFAGAQSGSEYQLSATVVNTANISALPVHLTVGETELEDVFSAERGWPGGVTLVQDRLIYHRVPAITGAMAMSAVGEYFDLNIKGQSPGAARLDKIRSVTNELLLAVKESKYMLVFSDRAAYFNTNRTIDRSTPPNFVKASETGIQPNCKPFDMEGMDYYVAINPEGLQNYAAGGKQLLSIVYDDVSTSYNAEPVSLLATHLVDRIVRSARQRPLTDLDAARGWLMRTDGRLICGQFVRSQQIVGFCEWIAAAGGLVREIGIDGQNRLWLAIERMGGVSIELYDPALFLQDALEVLPDLAGVVSGLPYENGATVWAVADGYVLGPFTVSGGSIDLEDSYAGATVGRWQPPRHESMPQVYVNAQDDVILRPGRIHTAHVNVIDTTSIAVGANGEAVEEVALARAGDPPGPPPPRTELVTVTGLTGAADGTTLVITQMRPGTWRWRDYAIGAKL